MLLLDENSHEMGLTAFLCFEHSTLFLGFLQTGRREDPHFTIPIECRQEVS